MIAQQLVRDKDGNGRHGVFEVLLNTPRVSDLIRRGDLQELKSTMMRSKEAGMQTFDQALFALLQADKISLDDAMHSADSPNDLRLMLKSSGDAKFESSSLKDIKINL